jgi:tetratricopeptide (TPR) repeat protein
MIKALMLLPLALLPFTGAAANLQDRIQAGIQALQKNDLAGAQANFEAAAKIAPDNPAAWLLLAQTYAKQKNQAATVEAARKAETLGAASPDILQGLANLYSGFDTAKAAEIGARYAELRPEDRTAWQRLAAYCMSTGQPERAIEAATRALKSGNSAALHALLGSAHAERKRFAQASAEYSEAVKLNPYDEDLHFRLAQIHLLQHDWVPATSVLEGARKYFDKSPQIELALGVAFYGQRDFPRAVDQFLKTIRLDPGVPQPYVFLGRILEHVGDRLPEVTAGFAAYQARNPQDSMGYVLHAKAILVGQQSGNGSKDTQSALDLLQQALKLNEDDAQAHYLAGTVLERRGEFAKAAAHLERSVALDAKDPAPHFRLARVYARLGRKQDSERERALHEKLSADVNVPDARGVVSTPTQPAAVKAP